jgi:hypothetical protein
MIIGISGAQGQGKTTLIQAAIEAHDGIVDGGLQTARTLLDDWGYSLTEINKYMPLKIRYQENLLFEHTLSLTDLQRHSDTVLVERTFADIFVYALVSVGPFNEYSDWLNDYAQQCMEAQRELFECTIFLTGRDYEPEEDSVRSTNPHFSAMVDNLIAIYMDQFGENNVFHLNHPGLDERVAFLLSQI